MSQINYLKCSSCPRDLEGRTQRDETISNDYFASLDILRVILYGKRAS